MFHISILGCTSIDLFGISIIIFMDPTGMPWYPTSAMPSHDGKRFLAEVPFAFNVQVLSLELLPPARGAFTAPWASDKSNIIARWHAVLCKLGRKRGDFSAVACTTLERVVP